MEKKLTLAKDDTGKVEEFDNILEAIKHYSKHGYVVVDEQDGGATITMVLPSKETHIIWGDAPVNKVEIRTSTK